MCLWAKNTLCMCTCAFINIVAKNNSNRAQDNGCKTKDERVSDLLQLVTDKLDFKKKNSNMVSI